MIARRLLPLLILAPAAAAQEPPASFVELTPSEGRAPIRLNAMQVVRVARLDGATVLDTTAYVQQRSSEGLEPVIRRLQGAGLRMVPLTDLNGGRTYLALDRIVLVRPSEERHAAGARAAIVVAGLRFATDVAVRETVADAMAAIAAAR
jgi:hypothetical protein